MIEKMIPAEKALQLYVTRQQMLPDDASVYKVVHLLRAAAAALEEMPGIVSSVHANMLRVLSRNVALLPDIAMLSLLRDVYALLSDEERELVYGIFADIERVYVQATTWRPGTFLPAEEDPADPAEEEEEQKQAEEEENILSFWTKRPVRQKPVRL